MVLVQFNSIEPPSSKFRLIANSKVGNIGGSAKLYQCLATQDYFLAVEDDALHRVEMRKVGDKFASAFIEEFIHEGGFSET
jgi:hypothetical protein